jgi:hypothetical protein
MVLYKKGKKSIMQKKMSRKNEVNEIVVIIKGNSQEINKDKKENDQNKRIIKSNSIILIKGDDFDKKKR